MLTYRLRLYCPDEENHLVDSVLHQSHLDMERKSGYTFISDLIDNDVMYLLSFSDDVPNHVVCTFGIFTSMERAKQFYYDGGLNAYLIPVNHDIEWVELEIGSIMGTPDERNPYVAIFINALSVDSSNWRNA